MSSFQNYPSLFLHQLFLSSYFNQTCSVYVVLCRQPRQSGPFQTKISRYFASGPYLSKKQGNLCGRSDWHLKAQNLESWNIIKSQNLKNLGFTKLLIKSWGKHVKRKLRWKLRNSNCALLSVLLRFVSDRKKTGRYELYDEEMIQIGLNFMFRSHQWLTNDENTKIR